MLLVGNLKIQDAKKEHAQVLSQLIYTTEEDPELIWGLGSKEEIIKRLTKLVKDPNTRYSYQHTRVAIQNEKICGAMIALPHKKLTDLNYQTEKLIMKLQEGLWEKLRWIFAALKNINCKESQSGEYYIANLATFNWARGKGIGTKLMEDAEEQAQHYGLNKCSLLVDQERPKVVDLYSTLGYQIKEEVLEEQKYYRMIKPLGLV